MGFHQRQWNHFQSRFMSCLKIQRAGMTGIHCSKPCSCTNAPCIARFQTRETMLGRWRYQIIPATFGKFKKGLGDQTTHCMTAPIVLICVAFSIPIPTCHRVTRTTVEGLAEYVFAWVHTTQATVVIDEGLFASAKSKRNTTFQRSCRRWVLR
jgi:hypothetical protein